MTISFNDKLKIICCRLGVYEKEPFVDAYLAHQPSADRAGVEANRENWFDQTYPSTKTRETLVDMLQHLADKKAPHLGSIGKLLDAGRRMTTPEFIELCDVRFPDLKACGALSHDARLDWEKRYNGMHFMEKLFEFEEHDEGRRLLKAILGTYHLYRRHSVLPGILREVVVVKERRYGHSEGVYYQYKRGNPGSWNEIDFNVFYAGFYLLAFGAFKSADNRWVSARERAREQLERRAATAAGQQPQEKSKAKPAGGMEQSRPRTRTEILEIKILIENALVGDGDVDCEQNVFAGILTGIYDYGNILLAERILLRRISDSTTRAPHMIPERLLPDDKANASEYHGVLDAIDNATNGQTLSIRPIHLEKPFLLDELLPDRKP